MIFKHKRVAIDFDGTIFEDCGNIDRSFETKENLKVKSDAAAVTQWLKQQGFEILIFTCRPDYHRKYLEGLLSLNHVSFDYILFYTKPRVDLYIDDKGFRFESWQKTKEWVREKLSSQSSLQVISQEPNTDFETTLRSEKIKYLPIDQLNSVLDVGCGSGSVWKNVKTMVMDGVEPDQNLKHLANETGKYRKIFSQVSDAKCGDYDCVTLLGVLEHIPQDQAFLQQFAGAKSIYLTVPNAESFHRQIGLELGLLSNLTELKAHDHEVGHQRYYTYDSFQALVSGFGKSNGFDTVFFGSTSFKFTSNEEMKPFISRSSAIFSASEKLGLVGKNAKLGAELVAYLKRREA